MRARTNIEMAQVIANGLVVDEVDGSASAWAYLEEHGIPLPTILRVLVSESRRRESDPGAVRSPG
jgi:hypothetical protein